MVTDLTGYLLHKSDDIHLKFIMGIITLLFWFVFVIIGMCILYLWVLKQLLPALLQFQVWLFFP